MKHKFSQRCIAMGIVIALIAVFIVMIFSGCTQTIAKHYDGTYETNLPANQKLIEVTWKGDDLWYLTRPMHQDEEAETYKFEQSKDFSIIEGTVIIHEVKESN